MGNNRQELKGLAEAEASYEKFYTALEHLKVDPSSTTLIHTALVLKAMGRRPIVLLHVLDHIRENEGCELSKIYSYIETTFGEKIRKKFEAGAGLPQYLRPLVGAGLLRTEERKTKIKKKTIWLPAESAYVLNIDRGFINVSKSHDELVPLISDYLDELRLPLKVVRESEKQSISSVAAFDPIDLLESLIKSDIPIRAAINILKRVRERLVTSEYYTKAKIPIKELIKIIDEEIGKEVENIDPEKRKKFARMATIDEGYFGSYFWGSTENGEMDWIAVTATELKKIIAEAIWEIHTPEQVLQKMEVKLQELEKQQKSKNEYAELKIECEELKSLIEKKETIGFSHYLIGNKYLQKVTNNMIKIIKFSNITYWTSDFLKSFVKLYLEDKGFIYLHSSKKSINMDLKLCNDFLDISLVYLIQSDFKNSIYYAASALGGYYRILFVLFEKKLGSDPLSSLTRFDKEIFADDAAREKLKSHGVLDFYSSTARYFKKESKIGAHSFKGKTLKNVPAEEVIKLIDRTKQVREKTEKLINELTKEENK